MKRRSMLAALCCLWTLLSCPGAMRAEANDVTLKKASSAPGADHEQRRARSEGRVSTRLPAEDEALAYLSLVYAAEHGDRRVVEAWIRRGVDVNGRGLRPDRSKLADFASMTNGPLVVAAARGHVDVVKTLLSAGAEPNRCCCSCITALHEAIRNGHAEIVRILLGAGANPRLLFDGTTSPLDLARQKGDVQIQKYLEERLKEPLPR